MPSFDLVFRPGVTTTVTVDERNFLFYAAQPRSTHLPAEQQVIAQALAHPIGVPPLETLLRPGQKVVILVDDSTRPTPAAAIIPHLLRRISRAGIPDRDVSFFTALGTHRPMSDDELDLKLGPGIRGRFTIINREYLYGDFVDLGKTESGTPIFVERAVAGADIKIAIGNIVPHVTAGWGGGSKIIMPGCCSQATVDMVHFMGCTRQPVMDVLGVRDTEARAEMDAIAGRMGLNFIVNTLLDDERRIVGVFAGHYVEAHRAGVKAAEDLLVIPIPARADIVIASANPCHVDYWQGLKPYTYAHLAVRDGGVIIFMLDGSEGLCGDAPSHEETVRRYLLWPVAEQLAAVERGEIHDLVGLNVPLYHASIRRRVHTMCVSNHLTQRDLDDLGFAGAPDVQTALQRAYELVGRDAQVGLIPFGGDTLTRVVGDA